MVSLRDLNEGMGDGGSTLLVCPICHGELALEKAYRRLGRIRTGKLRCLKGCAVFPVIYGVPIMLLPGRPANSGYYMPKWASFLRRYGKPKLMEAIAAGQFDGEPEVTGSPVSDKKLKKVKRWMSKAGWQQHIKNDRTSSEDADAIAIGERLSQIESGVVADIACGGGFTTERVLQKIQPSVSSISVDISFDCVKLAGKRAELLGMSRRSMEICADARHLPFADEALAVTYTRYGFNHIHGYMDALKEIHRTLKEGGCLVATEDKLSMWCKDPDKIGVSHEEQLEILRRLKLYATEREFIEHVEQVGFGTIDMQDIYRSTFLMEATKT